MLVLAPAVHAQAGTAAPDDDLGDTGAPPPTPEELGKVEPEAPPAPAPEPPKKRKKKPEVDAGPAEPPATRPAPATAVAPAVAPPPGPPPELIAKAAKLAGDLNDALIKEPGDARALDALASSAPGDPVLAAEPDLKPLMKLARARALLLQGRAEEATTAANEARGLVDAVRGRSQRGLIAQLRYRQAEIEEARAKTAGCGPLGLRRIAALEGKHARARVEQIAAKYRHAVIADERFWSRRAAYRIAAAYDDFYRKALVPPASYRGTTLPAPLWLARIDSKAVVAAVLNGAWPAEISRLYAEVIASIDAREPDPALLALVRERSAAFARVVIPEGEAAVNPWLADEKPGLVRHHRKWQRKQADGAWTFIPDDEGKATALAALRQPVTTIEHAYAIVSLIDAGEAVPAETVLAALGADEPRVTLVGLLAAEKAPDVAFLDVLVTIAAESQKGAPFSTLQGALYGTRERALLALRALADDDRASSEKLLADDRLSTRERAWIVAEVGESRLQYALQGMISDRDPQAGATALYALLIAVGNKASGYLRPNEPGPVGCVSKALDPTK